MHNDREKLIEDVCQKVNNILDQCEDCHHVDNKIYHVDTEKSLVFHLRVLHFFANPNDNEDKVLKNYKFLQEINCNSFVSKGTLHSVSLNQIHWENLLSQLVIRTYPSFVRK